MTRRFDAIVAGSGIAPGEAGEFGRLLDWLTNGRLRFASRALCA